MLSPVRKNLKPEERSAQLLDCAQILFAQKGFEATTISDVMTMAGVSKGGFYHHFDSKEALLEALAMRMAEDSLKRIQPILDDASLDPFARLEKTLKQLRAQKVDFEPDLSRAFEVLFQPANAMLYDRVRRAISRQVAPVLVGMVEEGVKEGVFDVCDPEICIEVILSLNAAAYDGIAAILAARDGGGDVDAAVHRFNRLMHMQSITVDRLLGLPDGSITWMERGTLEKLFRL